MMHLALHLLFTLCIWLTAFPVHKQAPHRAHAPVTPPSPKTEYKPASPSTYPQAGGHPAARPDPYAHPAYYQHMKHAAAGKDGGLGGHPPAAYPGYPPYPGMPAASGYMRPQGHAEPEPYKFQAGMPMPGGHQSDTGKEEDMAGGTTMRPQHRNNDSSTSRRLALPARAPAMALANRAGAAGSAAAAGGGQIIRRKGGPMRGTHPAEINKQITTAKDVWLIVDIVLQHGAEFDAVNVATALHRMAKACPEDPTELLRSNGFEQLLLMVEAQVQVYTFSVTPCMLRCSMLLMLSRNATITFCPGVSRLHASVILFPVPPCSLQVLVTCAMLYRLTSASLSTLLTSCGPLGPWGTSPASIYLTSFPSRPPLSLLDLIPRTWPI